MVKLLCMVIKLLILCKRPFDETARRREIQEKYNKEHGIIPQTIKKEIREAIHGQENVDESHFSC